MARQAVIEREKKRIALVEKYKKAREDIKSQLKKLRKDYHGNFAKIEELASKLASFPRNAIPVRLRNRCKITGRPRGVYRKVGISRTKFRELAMQGDVPGLVKSSW